MMGCLGLDDEGAMSGVRCKYAVVTDEVRSRARYSCRQTRDEVVWFEQYVRRCISKWSLEFIHHQAISIDAQALLGYRWAGHVSA